MGHSKLMSQTAYLLYAQNAVIVSTSKQTTHNREASKMSKKSGKDAQEEADRKTRRRIARERELAAPKVRAATFRSAKEYRRKGKYGGWE